MIYWVLQPFHEAYQRGEYVGALGHLFALLFSGVTTGLARMAWSWGSPLLSGPWTFTAAILRGIRELLGSFQGVTGHSPPGGLRRLRRRPGEPPPGFAGPTTTSEAPLPGAADAD